MWDKNLTVYSLQVFRVKLLAILNPWLANITSK